MKPFPLLLALLPTLPAAAGHLVPNETFQAIAGEFSGETAQEHVRRIVQYHRIQGSPMMAEVAERVVLATLKAQGYEARLEQFPSDGRTRYGTFTSPMGWEMRGGELWIEKAGASFTPARLCRYADVPMCVSTYSRGGTFTGALVDVGAGTTSAAYEGVDVKGRVVLASGYAEQVVRQAVVKRGAVGAVIYPDASDRPDHPGMLRYNGLWPRAEELEKTSGSFQVSARQYAELKAQMASGPVTVRGTVDATLGPGVLTLVHAYLRGSEQPEREVLLTAHLDHPKWSANDNATGSAALLELARTLKTLIDAKKIAPPRRTLHFMWVPEFYGTLAWVASHPEARRCEPAERKPCIVANLNLDMVGEDTVKTNSQFLMTRAPLSVPSFLDALLPDVLEQTRAASLTATTGTRNTWPASMGPYAQGSDHDVLLGLGIPASMLWHDPDWTHHTSEDTPDKTDASELLRVGVLSAAASHWLASAGPEDWKRLDTLAAAARLSADAGRLARLRSDPALAAHPAIAQLTARVDDDLAELTGRPRPPAARQPSRGPRNLTLLPLDRRVLESLEGQDARWWDEQIRKQPDSELLVYEAINFMDGRRGYAEIAALLTAELGRPFDAAWVARFAQAMSAAQLVALP